MGEVRDWFFLMGKSFLVIIGGILFVAGLVDTVVVGWNWRASGALLVGLAMAAPPIAFAFRDALRSGRRE